MPRDEQVPLLSNQYTAGSKELLLRDKRRRKQNVRPLLLNMFVYQLHDDISKRFEMVPRKQRIAIHLVFGLLNVFSFGLFGLLYWVLRITVMKEENEFEIYDYENQIDGGGYKPKNVFGRDSISEKVAIIEDEIYVPISQVEMATNVIGISPREIQKSLIDMNTFLFTSVNLHVDQNHKDYKQLKNYLKQWNVYVEKFQKFIQMFVKSFEFQFDHFEEVKNCYKGEYNGAVKDIETLQAIDLKTQEFMFSKDLLYKGTGRHGPTALGKEWKLLSLFQNQLDETYNRILECCPVPESYLEKLPSKARDICNYERYFGIWNNVKQDPKKFLESLSIDPNNKQQSQMKDLINQLEQIQAIWIEKKAKTSKSKKLTTLQHILHGVKAQTPMTCSRLSLARKTEKDDVCNMLRVWMTELLLGRISLLQRYYSSAEATSMQSEQPETDDSDEEFVLSD